MTMANTLRKTKTDTKTRMPENWCCCYMTAALHPRGRFFYNGSGPRGSGWWHADRDNHWVQLLCNMCLWFPVVQVPRWPKFPDGPISYIPPLPPCTPYVLLSSIGSSRVGAPFDSKDVPLDPLEPPGRPRDSLRPLSKGRGKLCVKIENNQIFSES